MTKDNEKKPGRRNFLKAAAGAAAIPYFIPAAALGKDGKTAPSDRIVMAGIGIGSIFGNYLSGAMRNPSAAPGQFTNLLIGFALAEATGLFGLLVALIILFG